VATVLVVAIFCPLRLNATTINVPPDPAPPKNVPAGTVVNVLPGGVLGDNFNFDIFGATLNVSGGAVGNGLFTRLDGSISSGSIGNGMRMFGGNLAVSGGSIGDSFTTFGGTIAITNGSIGDSFTANSTIEMSGGSIGSGFRFKGNVFDMTGGSIGDHATFEALTLLNLRGGTIGAVLHIDSAGAGDGMHVFGTNFLLNGLPIAGLSQPGDTLYEETRGGALLTGILQDGSPFSFTLNMNYNAGGDAFGVQALQLTFVPEPSSYVLVIGPIFAIAAGRWRSKGCR
jgi:hypothetical protein